MFKSELYLYSLSFACFYRFQSEHKSCLCSLSSNFKLCFFFNLLQPVLYSYWRSSCSWRVRIALNLKEIPYDIKAVSLIKGGGEQHCNEYREVNPMEQVPSLCIGKYFFMTKIGR